jgi:hypothetical protein
MQQNKTSKIEIYTDIHATLIVPGFSAIVLEEGIPI